MKVHLRKFSNLSWLVGFRSFDYQMRVSSLLLLFIFITGKQNWALKCYYCNAIGSNTNVPTCDKPTTKECPSESNVCFKGYRNGDKHLPAGVYKDCAISKSVGCETKDGHRECYCSGDLCNKGDVSNLSKRPTIFAAFGFVILFFILN
ncbi:hypothetical protein M3Y98_00664500 [Aphelenchoides besseyi]|nr:hypothetical protein M3Y98_00664500 [Aphelenchoides besseyi]KAI6208829.1 hypothetical protein M3Y96_00156500 [Aphelenchoides besseyi]